MLTTRPVSSNEWTAGVNLSAIPTVHMIFSSPCWCQSSYKWGLSILQHFDLWWSGWGVKVINFFSKKNHLQIFNRRVLWHTVSRCARWNSKGSMRKYFLKNEFLAYWNQAYKQLTWLNKREFFARLSLPLWHFRQQQRISFDLLIFLSFWHFPSLWKW